jgi:hypothetical protein
MGGGRDEVVGAGGGSVRPLVERAVGGGETGL